MIKQLISFAEENIECGPYHIALYTCLHAYKRKGDLAHVDLTMIRESIFVLKKRSVFSHILNQLEGWGFIRIVQRAKNQKQLSIIHLPDTSGINHGINHGIRHGINHGINQNSSLTPEVSGTVSTTVSTRIEKSAQPARKQRKSATVESENQQIVEKSEKVENQKNESSEIINSTIGELIINNIISEADYLNNNIIKTNKCARVREGEEKKSEEFAEVEVVEVVENVEEEKPTKGRKSKPKKVKELDEYSLGYRIRKIIETYNDEYVWGGQDGRYATKLSDTIKTKYRIKHNREATDEEILKYVQDVVDHIHLSWWGDKWGGKISVLSSNLEQIVAQIRAKLQKANGRQQNRFNGLQTTSDGVITPLGIIPFHMIPEGEKLTSGLLLSIARKLQRERDGE